MVIQHQQMQLFFALFVVDSGDQHTAGVDAHHRSRRQVGDGDQSLANQLFRFLVCVDPAQDGALRAGSVVQRELQQLLGLLHSLTGLDLDRTEIGLRECVKVHEISEQRLNLHLAEVDLFLCLRLAAAGYTLLGAALFGGLFFFCFRFYSYRYKSLCNKSNFQIK